MFTEQQISMIDLHHLEVFPLSNLLFPCYPVIFK